MPFNATTHRPVAFSTARTLKDNVSVSLTGISMRSCTRRGSPHPSHCPSSQLSTVSAQALVRLPDKPDQNPIGCTHAFSAAVFFRKGDDFPSIWEEQGLPFPLFPKPWGHCNLPTSLIPLPALRWAQYPCWHRG